MAPTLLKFVPNRIVRKQTVAKTLTNRCWVRQITGGISVPAMAEYLHVWYAIREVVLTDTPDRLVWRWTMDGSFSVQLAYQALHLGSHLVPGCVRIWETWAPLRVKLFLWLAVRRRHWTTDRRRRHGLDTHDNCLLCDQEPETIDHIVVECLYSRQIWFGQRRRWANKRTSRRPGPSWNGGTHGGHGGQGAAEKALTHSLR
jgi:hypothetical protein